MKQCEQLREYNRWRRGDNSIKQPNPKKLGELLDSVADRLEVLEREHAEFFERWHEERRKREELELAAKRMIDRLKIIYEAEGSTPGWVRDLIKQFC